MASKKDYSSDYYGKRFQKNGSKALAEGGDNRDYLNFALEGLTQPPINISDIQEVTDRCSLYFQRCADEGLKPGIANMCVWLGISRAEWQKWCSGAKWKTTHQKVCNAINQVFDAQMESYMQNGKINPVSAIFLMKNNFGYVNDAEKPAETKDTTIQERSYEDILKLAMSNKKKDE